MVKLRDKETGAIVGEISDLQLQFMKDQLEEEEPEDTDYYINTDTLELFEEQGADPQLLAVLRKGLGDREEMDIEWSRS